MLYHSAYICMLRITVSMPLVTYFICIHIIKKCSMCTFKLFTLLSVWNRKKINKDGLILCSCLSRLTLSSFLYFFDPLSKVCSWHNLTILVRWKFIPEILAYSQYFCQFHKLVHVISFTHKSNRLISCWANHWLNNKSFCLIVNEIICSTVSAIVKLPLMSWA